MGYAAFLSPGIVVLSALILIYFERRYPYTPGQALFRKGFFNDVALYSIVQSYILSQIIAWLIAATDDLTHLSEHGPFRTTPVWAIVLLSLVVHDFYIYWFHRWQHHNGLLWRIHEAHHSNREVDWVAGSRSHSFEILINQTIEFLPLALLGAPPEALVAKATIDAVWGMYIHSNIDVHTGVLQYVINGPEMHRWHHAREITEGGLNFSTKFAVWDWFFGTASRPSGKPSDYGIDNNDYPEGYLAQHLYVFKRRP